VDAVLELIKRRISFQEGDSQVSDAAVQDISRESSLLAAAEALSPLGIAVARAGMTYELAGIERTFQVTGIAIVEPEQCLKFLRSLSQPAVEASGLEESLGAICTSVRRQLEEYVREHPLDRELDAFSFLPALAEQAARLEFESEGRELQETFSLARAGTLTAHRLVAEKQLLRTEEDRGFGPFQWHLDATPERYTELWQGAIAVLRELGPAADELAAQVAENLLRAIEELPARLDLLLSENHYKNSFSDRQSEVVKGFKATLNYMRGEVTNVSGSLEELSMPSVHPSDAPQ
jgi:hypothetical protein